MKLRLWPRRKSRPTLEEPATTEPSKTRDLHPEPEAGKSAPRIVRPSEPAKPYARPDSPVGTTTLAPVRPEELPAKVSLTLDEAKSAIRAAGGDVIQVGFLASAYRRKQAEDPNSAEAAAAHRRLCDLIGGRLRDCKLLAPNGTFELLEERRSP